MSVERHHRSAATTPAPARRPYDSRLRQARAAETRERIVAAGAEMFAETTTWDWTSLTFRAVAERSGVSERTVYRYFPTDIALREAIGRRVEEQAGVAYDGATLLDFGTAAEAVLGLLPGYTARWPVHDHDLRRTEAVRRAVDAEAEGWTARERTAVAAAFDVVWSVSVYERMLRVWQLDEDEATGIMRWLHGLITGAIAAGVRPPNEPAASRSRART